MTVENNNDVVKGAKKDIEQYILIENQESKFNAGKEKKAISGDGKTRLYLSYSVIIKRWHVYALVRDQRSRTGTSSNDFESYEDALEYFKQIKCKYDLDIVDDAVKNTRTTPPDNALISQHPHADAITKENDLIEDAKEDMKLHILNENTKSEADIRKEKDAYSDDRKIRTYLSLSGITKKWEVLALITNDQSKIGNSFRSFESYEDALEYFQRMTYKYALTVVNDAVSDVDK